jgi:hypothetical protein
MNKQTCWLVFVVVVVVDVGCGCESIKQIDFYYIDCGFLYVGFICGAGCDFWFIYSF